MSFTLTSTDDDLKEKIADLKGQLNVCQLQLKDKEFTLNKKTEGYESRIEKLTEENIILKDKFGKVSEGQRSLEVQNSKLEDRLLNIV